MKKQKIVRMLALLCTLASLLSSVAFAAVELPGKLPSDKETYVIVPYDQYDFGRSVYPNGISEKKVPIRSEGAESSMIIGLESYFSCVYTPSGEEALYDTSSLFIGVRRTLDASLYGDLGYIRSVNVVPKLQMRKVAVGQGTMKYYSSIINAKQEINSIGALTTGDRIRFVGVVSQTYTDSYGNKSEISCVKIQIYFPDATTGSKVKTVYIHSSQGLTSY